MLYIYFQYVFADVVHKVIYTTRDYGHSIVGHSVPFSPKQISLHAKDENIIVGHDDDDPNKEVSNE